METFFFVFSKCHYELVLLLNRQTSLSLNKEISVRLTLYSKYTTEHFLFYFPPLHFVRHYFQSLKVQYTTFDYNT